MKTATLLLGGLLLTNVACGMSPVLNHSSPIRAETGAIVADSDEQGASCSFYFASQDLCANLVWVKVLNRDNEGSFALSFFNQSKPQVMIDPSAASVFVKLWMPDMGHGSQKVVVNRAAAGVFGATEVFFVMSGKWEIILQLKDAAGKVIDSSKINYVAE